MQLSRLDRLDAVHDLANRHEPAFGRPREHDLAVYDDVEGEKTANAQAGRRSDRAADFVCEAHGLLADTGSDDATLDVDSHGPSWLRR